MKTPISFCVLLCTLSALSLAESERDSPSATLSPANQFLSSLGPKKSSTTATTTTVPTTTTTNKPNTTTTTTVPTTTTTNKPNTTTTNTTTVPTTTTTNKPNTTTTATTTTVPTTTTTTKPNTTTTTTTVPTTTTTTKPNTTTTTTVPTTTTTTKPNTTTTTTVPTTTTTTKPNTTTTTVPATTTTTKSTTMAPTTPTPSLKVGNYTLMATGQKGVICLMAQMALQIRLQSTKVNGTFIIQPNLTNVTGSCNKTTAELTLTFKEGYITFMFNKSAADNTVYVNALSFSLDYAFSNTEYRANNQSVHLFEAKVAHSYSCKKELLYMGNGLYLDVSKDRMQAFNLTKSNDFGKPNFCPADQPSYSVAIAVGVTLLVLIIIVVVAYLLSRRKRTGGYQAL